VNIYPVAPHIVFGSIALVLESAMVLPSFVPSSRILDIDLREGNFSAIGYRLSIESLRGEFVPEYEERQPDGEVSAIVPNLPIHEIAESLDISVEAAYALVNASLRG
jgi:hypothetical protein